MPQRITEFLQTCIDAGDFPSAVYLIAEKGEIIFHDALGYAVVEPERIKARLDTIYDLASLTKVLVTGPLVAKLIESGRVKPSDLVCEFFPSASGEELPALKVGDLLLHTSGLPAWEPLYLTVKDPAAILDYVLRIPVKPGAIDVLYSDLNFQLLGFLLEEHYSEGLNLTFQREVVDLLGLKDTSFVPRESNPIERIAASENGNRYEEQTCVELGYLKGDPDQPNAEGSSGRNEQERATDKIRLPHTAFRNGLIWGEVHDGNAHFMGGVAGHAGLFSTAEEVFKIAQQFLPNYTRLLEPGTCELFRTDFTEGMHEDRSFGFQLASTEGSTAGTMMSPDSFGHNGFTGSCLWIDPVKERIFVLLTNRTHNHPLPFVNINSVRRRFHDIAIELLDEKFSN
ncbi:MAG: serine hydrolase [Pyrinomonadaceae bacterium]